MTLLLLLRCGLGDFVLATSGCWLLALLASPTLQYAWQSFLVKHFRGFCCRRQLPHKYRAIINEAIGGEMEFDMLHRWFNSTFLISASLSLLLFYGLLSQKRQEASDRLPLYIMPSQGKPHEQTRRW